MKTITYNGITENLKYWAEATGIQWEVLNKRISLGWSEYDILHTPVEDRKPSKELCSLAEFDGVDKGLVKEMREGNSNSFLRY
jgi:hypothetical protein